MVALGDGRDGIGWRKGNSLDGLEVDASDDTKTTQNIHSRLLIASTGNTYLSFLLLGDLLPFNDLLVSL